MSERVLPKHHQLFRQEIETWLEEKIITQQIAETLAARYPNIPHKINATAALLIVGAVLIGLGTILFIAANWQHIAGLIKLALVFAAVVVSHYCGWRFEFEPGNRPKLGTALMLLGSFFFGGGIWLVAQLFNVPTDFSVGVLLWAVGTMASALVARSTTIGCLASILIAIWTFLNTDGKIFAACGPMEITFFSLGTIASLAMAAQIRSRASAWITLLSGTAWMVVASGSSAIPTLTWGLSLFVSYLWISKNRPLFSAPFKYVGSCASLVSLLGLTFNKASLELGNHVVFAFLVCVCLVISLLVIWRQKEHDTEAIGCIGVLLLAILTHCLPADAARLIGANIVYLAAIGGLIYSGLNKLQSQGLVNVGIVFFVLEIISRYFDYFFLMMDRSVFFIVGGIVLMVVGSIAENSRRKLIGGMQT